MAHKVDNRIVPTLAGEFYGNWNSKMKPVVQFEHEETSPNWTKVRSGRPRPAGGRTVEQMEADGWEGLYLRNDVSPPTGAQPVAAPEWMTEPSQETA